MIHEDKPLLSRVADSVYWMARYIERAENVARFIEVNLHLQLDLPPDSSNQWQPLIDTSGDTAAFQERYGSATQSSVIGFLALDGANPNSITACLRGARENARSVRETISSEMWEQVNSMYLQIQALRAMPVPERLPEVFRGIRFASHMFQGITDATMSHGEGWQFIQLGRYVERSDTLAALLDTHFDRAAQPADQPVDSGEYLSWVGLLRGCAAFEAYCQAHTAEIRPLRVAEFLILNPDLPHSIRFSVDRMNAALHLIGDLTERREKTPSRIAGRLRAKLSFSQIEEIMAGGVAAYLRSVRSECAQIHDAIHQIYFDYSVEAELVS